MAALLLRGLLAWLHPLIPLAGLVLVAVGTLAQAHVGAFKHKRREELMRVLRRLSMLGQEASNFKAGKDLRLYRMGGRFKKVFEPLMDSYEAVPGFHPA